MSLLTESLHINRVRKLVVELLIANHEWDCLTCARDNNCKLQETAAYLGIGKEDLGDLRLKVKDIPIDTSNPFFNRDLKKCILCGICVRVCGEILGVSARVKGLNILHGQEVVEINPQDASDLGVGDGDMVKVISRRGEVKARAKSTETTPPGLVFMAFHFSETPTNLLTNSAVDYVANTPELKVCAVRVEKLRKDYDEVS